MKKFLEYCYYKTSKFYEDWGESDGHIAGSVVIYSLSLCCIALTLTNIVLHLLNCKLTGEIINSIIVPFLIASFFTNKKKYKKLEEQYRNEKHKKLKGWLVFMYVAGTVVLYFVSMIVLDV